MRNTALLSLAMREIEAHPENYDQSWYFTRTDCGSVACFAGIVCRLCGWQPTFLEDEASGDYGPILRSDRVVQEFGQASLSAFDVAKNLLGLTDREAIILFAPTNSLRMLRLMVQHLYNKGHLLDLCDYEQICKEPS